MSEWIPFKVSTIAFYGLICFIAGNANMYIVLEELKPWKNRMREKYGYLIGR